MRTLLLLSFLLLSGCAQEMSPADEYVLIEFASKLEEDYQKLHPEQNDQNQN